MNSIYRRDRGAASSSSNIVLKAVLGPEEMRVFRWRIAISLLRRSWAPHRGLCPYHRVSGNCPQQKVVKGQPTIRKLATLLYAAPLLTTYASETR